MKLLGDIKLTLNGNPTTYRLGSTIESTVTVFDDDAPELEITAGSAVVEADNVSAQYVISTKVSPNSYITVRYDLTESANFIHNEGIGKTQSLDFTNNATEATISIRIVNDNQSENDGTITVTLTDDTANPITYTLAAAPANTASVNIIDDESLPVVMIEADSGDVAENIGTANFNLTATGLSATTTLMINATPAEDGSDFLTNAIADTPDDFPVEFSDSDGDDTYTGTLSVTLDNDEIGEPTGDIKLTLNPTDSTSDYQLGSTTEGVITIWDNDAPELKITASTPLITEAQGVSADFLISAEVSANDMVTVIYDLVETQDFITTEGTDLTANLDFRNGVKQVTLPIAITNDGT